MRVPNRCLRRHSETEFRVEDVHSVAVFLNPGLHAVQQIEVDGCVIRNAVDRRCDWLIYDEATTTSIYVEPKGSDVEGGFEQIVATYRRVVPRGAVPTRVIWIISYSGNPPFSTSIQQLTYRAKSVHKATLRVGESPYEHKL
jgi:hypothetical protein